ncbi:tetratricopeptide repeat protein [Olleya namhaensis]|uniref:tetratricopeptide repeat protein n=1 Tax=Olleya namhaensis TaxID=1144750 RepID=UPI0024939B59|nr:tetratricopeptide repeat protein [Olleya namhaensis]
MNKSIIIILSLLFLQCNSKTSNDIKSSQNEDKTKKQEAIIEKYVTNCAEHFNYSFQMSEWQNCLDTGLKVDSTVAYLWQQKAMPYFKAKKYEVGMTYLDKAVLYKPERWLSYRAFIKCIFAKTYKSAIVDFEECIKREGNTYVMDHTYRFYIALSYLQLNEFEKAENLLKKDIIEQEKEWGEPHFLDLFYYGISKYEQRKWQEATTAFDKVIAQYPTFSDAKYYKSICLRHQNKIEDSKTFILEAKEDAALGNTINEANSIYEPYPYQVRW